MLSFLEKVIDGIIYTAGIATIAAMSYIIITKPSSTNMQNHLTTIFNNNSEMVSNFLDHIKNGVNYFRPTIN
jgi:hypothetical protein